MSPPDARVWDVELAALAVETTGLDPRRGDRVIEVAVVRGRLGEAPRVWTTLLDPGRPVGATHIHGITDAMVVGQPRFPAALPALARSLDGALPVAHNASFDNGFLKAKGRYLAGEMHGDWEFYRRDGSLMRRGRLRHGQPVGEWTTHPRAGSA